MAPALRILESYLHEMDVADFQTGSPIIATLKRTASISIASVPPAKKPNLSWKRRKEELLRLRAETQALETRAMFLKLRRPQATMLKAGVGLSEEQKRWRDAAVSEKQKCQSAQDENTQLKDKLESCYKACNDLQTVLAVAGIKQHNLVVANTYSAKALQAEMRSEHILQLSPTVLTSLENRVNESLSELEYLFNEARESVFGPDIDQVNVRREGVAGTSAMMEFKRNRIMPFDAAKTSSVIWGVMHLGVIPDEHCVRVSKRPDDILASQGCEMQPLEGGDTVDLRVSCVMKRVVVPGGFVVLFESTTEWRARPVQAKAWTHVTRDSGWALIYPDGPRPGTCRIQLAVRVRTDTADEQNGPTLLTPTVSNVVIPSFREGLNSRHQLVENALLDSSRTHSNEQDRLQVTYM